MAVGDTVNVGDYTYTIIDEDNAELSVKVYFGLRDSSSFGNPQGSVTIGGKTYKVTSMEKCFSMCDEMTTPPSLSAMTYVTDMTECFYFCFALTTAPDLTSMTAVTTMEKCFYGCESMTTAPYLKNMTNLSNLDNCFLGCNSMTTAPDLSGMTSITTMQFCFYSCSSITSPPNLSGVSSVSGWGMKGCFKDCSDMTSPPDMTSMTGITSLVQCFYGCESMTAPPDLSRCTEVVAMKECFARCTSLEYPPFISNMENLENVEECFDLCISMSGLLEITQSFDDLTSKSNLFNDMSAGYPYTPTTDPLVLIVPDEDAYDWNHYDKPSRVYVMQASASSVDVSNGPYKYTYSTDANGQITSLKCVATSQTLTAYPPIISKVTDLRSCFDGCSNLVVPPDMNGFSHVTRMDYCFFQCGSMVSPPDMRGMTSLEGMESCFYECMSMTSPPDMADLAEVQDLSCCFFGCHSMTTPPDLSNSTKVHVTTSMFAGCGQLRGFLLIGFGWDGLRQYGNMFDNMTYAAQSISQGDEYDLPASTSSLLLLVVPVDDRQYWTDLSKPSRVQVIATSASSTQVTMSPYQYTYSTDADGQLTSLACKAVDDTLTAYPMINPGVTSLNSCFYGCTSMTTTPDLAHCTNVTDMFACFSFCSSMTEPPDLTHCTAITNMWACFSSCTSLTAPPDLSNCTAITNMKNCFDGCSVLATPPNLSNCTAITTMYNCFHNCYVLAEPPDMTGLVAVTDLEYCFGSCHKITEPPDLTHCTAITNMDSCFYNCDGLEDPPDLTHCTAITDMGSCFYGCTSLATPPDLTHCTAITDMSSCFKNCASLTASPDLTHCTAITTMSNCFYNCTSLATPPDLTHCTAITILSYCFYGCTSLTASPNLKNCASITNLSNCFNGCASLATPPDLSSCTAVTYMGNCFKGCSSLESPPDLSGMTSLENMTSCFEGCSNLLVTPDLTNCTLLTSLSQCFYQCTKIRGFLSIGSTTAPSSLGSNTFGPSTQVNEEKLYLVVPSSQRSNWTSYSKPANVEVIGASQTSQTQDYWFDNMSAMNPVYRYTYSTDADGQLKSLACESVDKTRSKYPPVDSLVTSMMLCFDYCTRIVTPPDLANCTRVTNMGFCFWRCSGMTTPPDLTHCTAITTMATCFGGCSSLETPPDLTHNTAITDISGCFTVCTSLTTPPDLTNCTALERMQESFYGCTDLTIPPDLTHCTAITNLSGCFSGCTNLATPPDLTNCTAITDMSYCFKGCTSLTTTVDLTHCTLITDIRECFYGCTGLTTLPDLTNLTAVEKVANCFKGCTGLSGTLNVGSCAVLGGSNSSNAFEGTVGEIWIVPTADATGNGSNPQTSGDAWWFNVYRNPSGPCPDNVHFYSQRMNPGPVATGEVTRIDEPEGMLLEAATGEYFMVKFSKPVPQMVNVHSMPKVKKIVVWAGSLDDEDYIENTLSASSDTTTDATGRGMSFTRVIYVADPEPPVRFTDLAPYTDTIPASYDMDPDQLDNDYFYAFIKRDTTAAIIVVLVQDTLDNCSKLIINVPKAFATFSFLKPGYGVAVGIPARRSGLDVDMQPYFDANPMVYDIPTLPVVVTYASTIPDNAHLPDPCVVVQMDPRHVWSQLLGTPIANSGFKVFLRGSFLERLPQRAGRAFVTSKPAIVSSSPVDMWVRGDAAVTTSDTRVDSSFAVSSPDPTSQTNYFKPKSGSLPLLVSFTGCESVRVEFQNGVYADSSSGVSFMLYDLDVAESETSTATPVAISADSNSFTFSKLRGKPHTLVVKAVSDSSYDDTGSSLDAFVRIIPDPQPEEPSGESGESGESGGSTGSTGISA